MDAFHEISRRGMLHAGAIGMLGLSLPRLLGAENGAERRGRARSCILFFMEGGPAHQDLWDLKPEAPAEVRGEFQPIPTTVPGLHVCEHLPHLAQQMHRVALVRSVHHEVVDHNAGAYYALTGRIPTRDGDLIIKDEPDNFPPFGAICAQLRPTDASLPAFVHLPEYMSNNGHELPGQRAGFYGPAHDPLLAGDPSVLSYEVPGLGLASEVTLQRVAARRELLDRLNQVGGAPIRAPQADALTMHQAKAYELLTSPGTRRAFEIGAEPNWIRERYGMPDRVDRSVEARKFGGLPHVGQCLLLARRLIEAGVRLVTVASGRRFDQAWDTHRDHFPLLKRSLLPYTDRALAALLEDLASRGLLDDTLVVAMGEFGRTPRLGQITSAAGATANGRDHWPHCYTVLLAGGGIRGGAIYGASDRHAAYPASDPVTPEDIAATIYHALGIDPETRITDPQGRPHSVAQGKVIAGLFG